MPVPYSAAMLLPLQQGVDAVNGQAPAAINTVSNATTQAAGTVKGAATQAASAAQNATSQATTTLTQSASDTLSGAKDAVTEVGLGALRWSHMPHTQWGAGTYIRCNACMLLSSAHWVHM